MMAMSISEADVSFLDTTDEKDLETARKRTAEKSHTSGPVAEKQHENEDEENFIKIAEKVSKAIPRRYQDSSVPTIYVVPRDLATGSKEDPYKPEVVCIGPLFDETERAKEPRRKLESYKWCCLRKLLVNASRRNVEDDAWIPGVDEPLLRKCFNTVKDLEPRIRESYGDDISIGGSGNTLALMMLLDGSFLLHRIMVAYARIDRGKKEEDNDDWTQLVGRCGVWGIVTRDLLLLKNQIPFFVLQALLGHLRRSRAGDNDDILIKGGLQLLAHLRPEPVANSSSTITAGDVHHLLHLFYKSIGGNNNNNNNKQKNSTTSSSSSSRDLWVPCAKELEEAGVTFKKAKKQQTTSFLNVNFFRRIYGAGVLQIPPLELYDYSEALFRNLIAFEQTYLHTPGHVTSYATFMDCLIKTPDDMRLLQRSGVLLSHMNGDRDAVATGFFSKICAQAHIAWDQNYLQGLMEDVVSFQSTKWRRWRATLKRDYFSNPWATMSLLAAFLILAMTAVQTLFTVYGYYKPDASNLLMPGQGTNP